MPDRIPQNSVKSRPRRKRLRGFRRLWDRRGDDAGATAVEAALIMPVFLYLLMGIIEMALLFYTETVVDGAVHAAGRQIRTGQAQLSGDTLNSFKVALCNSLGAVYNCNKITVDVRSFSTFSSVSVPIEYDADGNIINTQFSVGGSSQIQAIRATYTWKFYTPLIGFYFGSAGANTRQISTTAVFRNEPYQ